MTPVSRLGAPGGWGGWGGTGVNKGRKPRMVLWHVPCLFLPVGGCLYWGPITYTPDENMAPEIVSFTDGTLFCDDETVEEVPDALCVVNETQLVHVTAMDDDGDVLEFFWEGRGSGPIGNAVTSYSGEFQNSQVTVERDSLVNGEELRCLISDGSDDPKIQSWTVVVL